MQGSLMYESVHLFNPAKSSVQFYGAILRWNRSNADLDAADSILGSLDQILASRVTNCAMHLRLTVFIYHFTNTEKPLRTQANAFGWSRASLRLFSWPCETFDSPILPCVSEK